MGRVTLDRTRCEQARSVAQPENGSEEPINALIWGGLMGPVESRSGFAKAVGYQTPRIQDTDLLGVCSKNSLPSLSLTDTGVPSNDPRSRPGYANEAIKRLILQFVIENRNEKFMKTPVRRELRYPKKLPQSMSLSRTSAQTSCENIRNRSRSTRGLTNPRGEMKRSRTQR